VDTRVKPAHDEISDPLLPIFLIARPVKPIQSELTAATGARREMSLTSNWLFWALLSATFAALTAIFAKVGIEHIDSDLATFIRTIVILVSLGLILAARGTFTEAGPVSARTWTFLVLSGLATGASWLCYFRALKLGDAAQVAPIDKLSVVLVALFAVTFLGESLTPLKWLGIALIGLGAVIIAL